MTENVFWAFVGALGVGLMVSAFSGSLRALAFRRRGALERMDALDPAARELEEPVTLLASWPLLDRILGSLLSDAAQAMARAGASGPGETRERTARLARRLRQSGYRFKTVGDFYAAKLLSAILFFLMGVGFIVLTGMTGLFFVPLVLGLAGLFVPDRELATQIDTRRKHLLVEMAFTLDRVALLVETGLALQVALREIAMASGGLFVAELRRAMQDVELGVAPRKSLDDLLERAPEMNELRKFVQSVTLSLEKGVRIAPALRAQSDSLRARVEEDLLSRGLASTLVITTISGAFILPALALVVIGPPMYLAFHLF